MKKKHPWDNIEMEVLINAWMRRQPMPAPCLRKMPDGRLEPIGKHDCAIIEAAKRLGADNISGVYIINCDDEVKLAGIARDMDKINEQILRDTKAPITDGQHRLRQWFGEN